MADIFREVEEDIRRDRLQHLWDKYGIYLIGFVVGIIALTSLIVGWSSYSRSAAEDASKAFAAAVAEAAQEGADASTIFTELADQAPSGYAALSRLRAAGALAEAGEIDQAIAAYDAVAADSSADEILRDLAKVKSGTLLVGRTSYDDLAIRLVPLAGDSEPWRNPAREALGMAAFAEQKYAQAQSFFQSIIGEQTATPGVRDRAHVMLALIAPHVPAAQTVPLGASESAPEESAPASSIEPTGEAQ
ncbi:tetratricopeptide repeat protein [Parvibaculaceae bacterium PLY_AMNH_Bact1]|nr:tetratricopeptide repeat protein [Parvibaculaceae bacterium PLY_AMNH_Bact1]